MLMKYVPTFIVCDISPIHNDIFERQNDIMYLCLRESQTNLYDMTDEDGAYLYTFIYLDYI